MANMKFSPRDSVMDLFFFRTKIRLGGGFFFSKTMAGGGYMARFIVAS